MPRRFSAAAQIVLIVAASLAAFRAYYGPALSEDAYIMLRYADNLAHGHGIVWNVGGPPVEGSTSFMFMALEAMGISAGLPAPLAAQILALAAVVAGALVLWRTLTLLGASPVLSIALAFAYVGGPATSLAIGGWDTPLFMLFTTLLVAALLLYSKERLSDRAIASLAPILCLAATLTRPEGLLWSVLAFAWLALQKRAALSRLSLSFGLTFLLPILVFTLWRHHYFGDWLPTPFYVKHEATLNRDALNIASDLILHQWLVLTAFLVLSLSRFSLAQASLLLLPLAHLGAFVLINNEQNILNRFQFPAWPAAALLAAYGVHMLTGSGARGRRLVANVLAGILLIAAVVSPSLREPSRALPDTIMLGQALRPLAGRGLWLCASEAGAMPFFSGWLTLDPHGLNDAHIAHHGLDFAYLDRFAPAILQFHTVRVGEAIATGWSPWDAMIHKMIAWCARRGYILAAVVKRAGVRDDLDFYFVRGGQPYTGELCALLTGAALDYLPRAQWPPYAGPHYAGAR
jgi:hypothetical protein